jgi:4-hydroxy-3-methylbut-2-enyl diphosphate reductase
MEVIIAENAGFCSGVQRAMGGVRERLAEGKGLYCLGELIHNPDVIESLEAMGMIVTEDIDSIPDGSGIIIRTHGLPQETVRRAREKDLEIHDFTCPRVKKTHHLVKRLQEEGYRILVIGNPDHPEVDAVYSLISDCAQIVERPEDVERLTPGEPVAVVVQTTFNPDVFYTIVTAVVSRCRRTLVCNTLCEETIRRQREAIVLAGSVDFMVVVGGKNSSNTRTLFRRVSELVTAVHIENADELQEEWFRSAGRVGILSGASTPAREVERVNRHILSLDSAPPHNTPS